MKIKHKKHSTKVDSGDTSLINASDWNDDHEIVLSVGTLMSAAGVVDIDLEVGPLFALALTENITSITFSNLPDANEGAALEVRFTQGSTPRTVAWPTSFRWTGAAPAMPSTSGAVAVLRLVTFDSGTKWEASLSADRSSGAGGAADPTVATGSLAKWAAAKARGAANPARLAFVGDSNVAGQGTGTGTNGLTGAAATCMARKFATLAGFQIESFFGEQNVLGAGGTVVGYDPRIALGSGWAGDTAPNLFGGRFMKSAAAPSGRLTFSPASAFSKFRIWHPISSVGNTATTVYVDGVLVDTFSEAGSNAFASKDYAVSAGTHVIGVGGGATGNVFVAGIEATDGSSAPVMLAGGWSGAKVADINGAADPWSYRNSLVAMAPDFTIVYCTINDANSKTAGNTYYSALEAFVKAVSLTSGGCLCLGFPANTAATNDSYYDALATSLKNLAADYGWFFYDSRRAFGRSFARATDRGYVYDAMHPNKAGSDAMASDLYAFLSAAGL